MVVEARHTRERDADVSLIDRRARLAVAVETVVARRAPPRDALLAEVVGDARMPAGSRTRVLHDLFHPRVRIGLEQRLFVEVDRRPGEMANAAVRLDHLHPAEELEGGACSVDGDAARLPVVDRVA